MKPSNQQFVTDLMAFGPRGPLSELFVIEAIRRYAEQVANAITLPDSSMFSGEAWKATATHIDAAMTKRLADVRAPAPAPAVEADDEGDDEDPMGGTFCDRCTTPLESGQIGLCDSCQGDDDHEQPGGNAFELACPQCGASDELDVTVTIPVRLTMDGTDADEAEDRHRGHEWTDQSPCSCASCGFTGTVAEFTLGAPSDDERATQLATNLAKLPATAFVTNTLGATGPHGPPPVLAITRGEKGYNPIYTKLTADELNEAEGVTKAQAMAMYNGSLFGFDAPGADPDNPINQKSA